MHACCADSKLSLSGSCRELLTCYWWWMRGRQSRMQVAKKSVAKSLLYWRDGGLYVPDKKKWVYFKIFLFPLLSSNSKINVVTSKIGIMAYQISIMAPRAPYSRIPSDWGRNGAPFQRCFVEMVMFFTTGITFGLVNLVKGRFPYVHCFYRRHDAINEKRWDIKTWATESWLNKVVCWELLHW